MKPIYNEISKLCANQAQIIVVSKKRSVDEIMCYYRQGVRDFGENRVDELLYKANQCPKDIRWHFIGHLQRNKVKQVLPYAHLIHSVESLELCQIIQKEASKLNKKIPVLIQFNIANEDTKTGLNPDEAISFMKQAYYYDHLDIQGMMCMGPHTDDETLINDVFQDAHSLFNQIKNMKLFPNFKHLSMGMSGDYKIALNNHATMLRIGSILF